MATLYQAQFDLIAEVKSRVIDLVPNYEEQMRFAVRDEIDRSLSDMDEETGHPRLFEIGAGEFQNAFYVGCGTRGLSFIHRIDIWYPDDERWSWAMLDDAERIRNDLITNATTTTGVQQRHLTREGGFEIERDDEDPWQRILLDMIVYYEVS